MKFFRIMVVLPLISLFLFGCAVRQQAQPMADFTPTMFNSNDYVSAVDNFLIILDASSSMDTNYMGNKKFKIATQIVNRMSQTLPELGQNAGLRSFGHSPKVSDKQTVLFYGMENFTQSGLNEKSRLISSPGGTSPMHKALTEAGQDLVGFPGKTAVIIITDGQEQVGLESPVTLEAAQTLKDQLGSELCFYPISVGDDENGGTLMDEIAGIGECGFASNADTLLTGSGMATFVRKIFLTQKPMAPKDSDNDGVTDDLDKCPGTPQGIKVNVDGCPPVIKTKAVAPPMGETWIIDEAYFDFDKVVVKPGAFDFLDKIAEFLKGNPGVFVKIQGHTDNVGTKAYNDILSLQRAQAVKTYLMDKGIDKSRMSCEGFGFSKPTASNETEKGRRLNRRVEMYPVK
ncbi:OmpA family protein [Desulfobacula sp.]|uniref:OmpA family protein n=1 Tax=Desulfobacula sp. TaxID=2593537 RepID=UPI002639226B|nr:OmpA family protein [Desulfobacula sp.]